MIKSLVISFFMGLLSHYTNGIIRHVSTTGWRSITLYIVRSALKLPPILLVTHELEHDIQDALRLSLISYTVASCAYGLGVIMGWLIADERP